MPEPSNHRAASVSGAQFSQGFGQFVFTLQAVPACHLKHQQDSILGMNLQL
ncbi:MAG: hypothetical protein ORN98_04750 [Alphaproteobacteria bacterium]|nr:hypothetical protein [Alphaproteobacteria bacterium]